ncbi:hypothetical protein [Massilia aquatica]|uniref:Exo-alpha-sialidase n=1 Tax=Massilia aquatica TaxID=2609000 RepID=A0ABX0MI89_9BURK|nr:hypothetical protein [Massilia aquatica]NHZ44605.1 hypothetical protein [Massilia aquatica]
MDVFLEKKRWIEAFSEFEIVDVAIQERNKIQLCARKRMTYEEASHLLDPDIPTRLITLFTDRPAGDNCGFTKLSGMGYPVVGVSRNPFPRPSGLVAAFNKDGDVWPRGGGSGPMEHIAPGKWPGTQRLKCINGYTYSVGAARTIYKRVEVGKWTPLNDGFPEVAPSSALGFNDMDAFSESDMYAVGGHGDVWHFNGSRWQQMGFPSNVQLGTVTCAGDGNVYISGEGGSLWVGGKSTWKPIYQGGSSILWNDVLWFQDKLWLASDYQFRQLRGKTLEPVMHGNEQVHMNGHMDVYDGLLVIAGAEYVQSFDGTNWRSLIEPYLD